VLAVAAAAPAAACLAAPATAAPPAQPGCGDVITQSIRLRADVICLESDGLTVAGDGVVVDLGGHTVQGYPFRGSVGMRVTADDVTVRRGTVAGDTSLFVTGARIRLADLRAPGILAIEGMGAGISRVDGGSSVFTSSIAGPAVRIADSTLEGGEVVIGGPGTVVARSTFTTMAGVHVDGTDGRIVDNAVMASSFVFPDTVLLGVGGAGAVVARNRVSGAGGTGVSVAGAGARVVDNEASGNAGDGIAVSGASAVVRRNVANANGGDGLRVTGAGALVAGNVARLNGALGIDAVAGTRDGGNNRASGNGDPRQCVGVVCRP
jgi:hypothetical protein